MIKYTLRSGRVFLTGSEALVRLPLMQRWRDEASGLSTAGFISGYRGSPIGVYDLALTRARSVLAANQIHFEPGVNEDLAATAILGSQQVHLLGPARYDGVFGIWYGKGPGVDRSGDALKHGAFAGTSPLGGVLALAGDDHACRSSTLAHQSDHAFIHFGMPVLNPASVQEYIDLGLYGLALSRYSGCWIAFKCVADTIESSASVAIDLDCAPIKVPDDFQMPDGGLHVRFGAPPLEVERRLFDHRLKAAQAFVRANGLDRVEFRGPRKRLGIVTTGKTYLDVRQAFCDLGITRERAADLGVSIYKVAMSWPLEPTGMLRFAEGLEELLVIEEKRPVIEEQIASLLYNQERRPRLVGKRDENGAPLLAALGELSLDEIAGVVAGRLRGLGHVIDFATGPQRLPSTTSPGELARVPAFCAGCPHNRSTVVPEGNVVMGGIGCHGMAMLLSDRRFLAVYQMGGDGAAWIGQTPFTKVDHIFQNLGDGTYFHSGLLAIRANVAANTRITFKILLNGVTALTGGQPIEGASMDGALTAPEICRQVHSEGVRRIAVLSDDPGKYSRNAGFPPDTTVHHRDTLDSVQRELRQWQGVSVLVYDQGCALERRRMRSQGVVPESDRRIFINEQACEGCGDCNLHSNCIAIEPVETPFGRKRRINQSACNTDYSCLDAACPALFSLHGAQTRKRYDGGDSDRQAELLRGLPMPEPADCSRSYNILVTGIGGTGVITIGALLGTAAHLEGKGCSVLDVTGASQKNGAVTCDVRIVEDTEVIGSPRIAACRADLVLGCDIVVASTAENLARISPNHTRSLLNLDVAPSLAFATQPDLDLSPDPMRRAIVEASGGRGVECVRATTLATGLTGEAITTNVFLLGMAFQRGYLPVGLSAIERAIETNGVAVALNMAAFGWGRLAAHDPALVERFLAPTWLATLSANQAESLDEIVARCVAHLTAYQSSKYADRYQSLVDRVAAREGHVAGGSRELAKAVARYYCKLLAYKDEYEVARLYNAPEFRRSLEEQFEGGFRVKLHFAPSWFARRDPNTGRPRKREFGHWFFPVLRLLTRLKGLRGTPFDIFGYASVRKLERRLIRDYELMIGEIVENLSSGNHRLAIELACLPEQLRGFDQVKARAAAELEEKQTSLMTAFRESLKGSQVC